MTYPFAVHPPERAYLRKVLLAVEVLDAVTLHRLTYGVRVRAKGLKGRHIVNGGGLFVWLKENIGALEQLEIDPGTLPYESVIIPAANVLVPLTSVELSPRRDYPFTAGMTVLVGTLIESRSGPRAPIAKADIWLRWLDDDDVTWHDAPTRTRTDAKGDFAAIIRLAPDDDPQLNAGALTVRLRARRAGGPERGSEFSLLHGRVADALPPFAWDELLP